MFMKREREKKGGVRGKEKNMFRGDLNEKLFRFSLTLNPCNVHYIRDT